MTSYRFASTSSARRSVSSASKRARAQATSVETARGPRNSLPAFGGSDGLLFESRGDSSSSLIGLTLTKPTGQGVPGKAPGPANCSAQGFRHSIGRASCSVLPGCSGLLFPENHFSKRQLLRKLRIHETRRTHLDPGGPAASWRVRISVTGVRRLRLRLWTSLTLASPRRPGGSLHRV